ncbi:GNAT family N-acetyltransferase [Entomomonas sp. E2T0]|uniref:GNAT family N-acetyltransferase n=1 Tax=Entomomonas sp. E2T0 TaxID=2930213 RepID=UPI0022283786|nr:GNAT family N-acetyltransferase [Entomomonas sp. E2T0]UYZ82973.1 GNAT family N-acetyltransferase [Entomomonas sp. E2T0]
MNKTFVRKADWQKDMVDIMRIREAVFINEQNVPAEQEWDDLDSLSTHFLAVDGSYAMGTARLTKETDDCARISRVAVLKDWRGLSIGDELLQAAIEEAKQQNFKKLTLTAQTHATKFYKRFGFEIVSDEFLEVGIPHVEMLLAI